jgi:hypothetical protein
MHSPPSLQETCPQLSSKETKHQLFVPRNSKVGKESKPGSELEELEELERRSLLPEGLEAAPFLCASSDRI